VGEVNKNPEAMPGERAMFKADIEYVATSNFGKTPDGQKIVNVLRRFAAENNITYGETEDNRAFVDSQITINKNYYGNICKTVTALVHEGSHLVWRASHPVSKERPESIGDAIENELYAQMNELKMYKWMKDVKKLCVADPELELRLERLTRGTLRSVIETREREARGEQ
jgi:hypothetical protein